MTHSERAARLRAETNKALKAAFPNVLQIKLLVSDLVGQIEQLSAAVDKLEGGKNGK